jgi:hypothetical protein
MRRFFIDNECFACEKNWNLENRPGLQMANLQENIGKIKKGQPVKTDPFQ